MKNTIHTIEFNEDGTKLENSKKSHASNFLIKYKIVKNAQQASLVLLCIAVALLLVSAFILLETSKEPVREYSPDPETFL